MPLEPWRHYWRARFYQLVRSEDRALAAYRDAIRSNPRFHRALGSLGFLLASRGELGAAEEQLARALEVEPGDAYSQFNLGFIRGKLGRHAQAIEAFGEAVRLRPKLDRAWYGMGLSHAALGDHEAAVRAFDQAASLQPMNPHAWYALGMAYHHSRNPDKVREVAEHLFRFDPLMTRRLIQDAQRGDLSHLVKDLLV